VALANSGDMQVELIQIRNDAPSMYLDYMEKGLRGLQHVAFWTTQFDTDLAMMKARGFIVKMEATMNRIVANYLLETPFELETVAAMMAGEQSSGTFVRVAGETDELRARATAEVIEISLVGETQTPTLHSAYAQRKNISGPYRQARIRIAYPIANIGQNLPTLAAKVSGNPYDIGEITGLKLLSLDIPRDYRARFLYPQVGIQGTRDNVSMPDRPIFGAIVKPNVGMRSADIAALVDQLCAADVDFIKDDEVCANPA
jgi:ribulose-bisphosphate carboxylase large chain